MPGSCHHSLARARAYCCRNSPDVKSGRRVPPILWSRGGAWWPTPLLKMKAGGGRWYPSPRAKDLVGTEVGTGDHSKVARPVARGPASRVRPRVHVGKFSPEVLLTRRSHRVVGGHGGGGYPVPSPDRNRPGGGGSIVSRVGISANHELVRFVVRDKSSRARARTAREWPGGEPGHLHFVLSWTPRWDSSPSL